MSNIDILAKSIDELGLLHPVVVDTRLHLIVGGRRLAALRLLGRDEAPCLMVENLSEAADALRAERDENTCREPLLPTEAAALARQIRESEKPAATDRMAAGRKEGGKKGGRGRPISSRTDKPRAIQDETKRTDSIAATATGMSRSTLRKAEAVTQAAQSAPERFGDLPQKMDAESVDAAYKELQCRQAKRQAGEPIRDKVGVAIKQKHVIDAFRRAGELRKLIYKVHALAREIRALAEDPVIGAHLCRQQIRIELRNVATELRFGLPFAVCPYCQGSKCENCRGAGWVPKAVYKRIPREIRATP